MTGITRLTARQRRERDDPRRFNQRDRHVAYLNGALDAVTGESGNAPVPKPLFDEYMLGRHLVGRGMIVIKDVEGMRRFITDVRAGRWPQRVQGDVT